MLSLQEVVANVRKGYTGNDVGARVWTFSSALMYSLTVFTTIGKPIGKDLSTVEKAF